MVKDAKNTYLKKIFEHDIQNHKLWKHLHSFKLNNKFNPIKNIQNNDKILNCSTEISNAFNSYFNTVGKNLASKFSQPYGKFEIILRSY